MTPAQRVSAVLLFAINAAVASTASADDRPTLAQVQPLMAELFADKTLVGDDHVTQAYGPLLDFHTSVELHGNVSLADGTNLVVIDTLITDDSNHALLIEDETTRHTTANYYVYITSTGSLLVVPRPEDAAASRFVSRECWFSDGKTVCRKTVKAVDGSLNVTIYRQQ